MELTISIKNSHGAEIPRKATDGSAGYDIYSAETVTIPAMARRAVSTGIYMSIPRGYEGQVRSRSGLCLSNGIVVLNSPGTIDSDYRGEVKVILYNSGDSEFTVETGMRIAQIVFAKVAECNIVVVDDLESTARQGGFGSTGLH